MNPWFTTLPWVLYLNFKTKACFHSARFEKATRYYVIRLEQDLLGDWTLCVSNGRIKSRLGQSRIIAFECFAGVLRGKVRNFPEHAYNPLPV